MRLRGALFPLCMAVPLLCLTCTPVSTEVPDTHGPFDQWKPASRAELQYDEHGMVYIKAAGYGFRMGRDSGDIHSVPAFWVSFTRDFWIDTVEVTQKLFHEVMGARPWESIIDMGWGDSLPAYNIFWIDAIRFCNALSKMRGFDTVSRC